MRIISVTAALSLILSVLLSAQNDPKFTLTDDPSYKEAISAMTDHLPTIAAKKFANLLATKAEAMTEEDRVQLLFLLIESQIRAFQTSEALITLTDPLIENHPDSFYWKGQALVLEGRYNDAIKILEKAAPESQHYKLAQIKIAYLAAALNDIDKALNILSKSTAESEKTNSTSPQNYLSLARLYLAKDDPLNATKMLEKIPTTNNEDPIIKVKLVIQAQIDILEEDYQEAIQVLNDLVKSPESLDRQTLNFATLYLADALQLSGDSQGAITTIITYLDENPDSPLLSSMFTRIGKWIPKNAAITDSTIKKLITWAERDQPNSDGESTLNNQDNKYTDLSAFAHYYYARFLATQSETTSKTKAIFELSLLRLRYPSHILAGTSLTDTATTQLALERIESAKETLALIQTLKIPIAPIARQQSAFLLGKLNLDEKNYQAAAEAFQTVVDTAEDQLQTAAIINAASAYLSAADTKGFQKLEKGIDDPKIQINLRLEYALWLANENKATARTILHDFTLKNPDHPRITEAKLALAHHCLRVSPVDPDLCQLTISEISEEQLQADQYADYTYLLYRNAIANMDFAGAANAATQFLETFPQHPREIEFILLQGQAYYHNGQHNDARRILLNLVKTYPKHPLKNYAKYYAAMSAKLEGTPQSQDEAILLFSNIVAEKSNLTEDSLIQLSQLYIARNQPKQAVSTLKPAYDAQPDGQKSLNLSLKLADAYHAQGDFNRKYYLLALIIYDTLIQQFQGDFHILNQIKYNQALTLQHMGNDEEALEIYYSVINIDPKANPITEWNWYYKCGFNAIAMLEEMKNPNGAIAIAKKLANSGGSRATEASNRARALEMKYMIWEF